MLLRPSLFGLFFVAVTSSIAAAPPEKAPPIPADHAEKLAKGQEIFAKQVRQVLIDQCVKCHGGEKTKADFDLATREGLLHGGNSKKPGIVPFKAKESRLFLLVTHQEKPHMPSMADKLSDEQIAHIEKWIDLGAPYDKPLVDKPKTIAKKPLVVTDEDRKFWSFQPLHHAELPKVKNEAWCKTPIDRFVLAKLEEKGLTPNAPVERRKLIRRAYFDLIGLPPTPDEIDAFVNNSATDAYEKLVDHLLDNPHFGERWARHWLDLARFAESHGYEQDYDRPNAYHYRDFVIKAFNQDLPYDTFVKWQLAGDEIEPENPLALMATGFLAAGTHATQITKNQVEKERYDELDDMARTTGTAMLGLTIGCARCHDHKYDPISTKDYYRFLSTFTTTVRSDYDINLDPKGYASAKAKFDAEQGKLVEARRQFDEYELPKHFDGWLVAELHRTSPKPKLVKALISSEGVPAVRLHTQGGDFLEQTHFLERGDPNRKKDVAPQSFLQVLMRSPDQEKHWQVAPPSGCRTSYRRRSLANWITDVDEGAGSLLARVIVNRLWQHHLGRGIVGTPSDFGFQGDRPTHPELLDWLASELIRNGWRLKPIHKLILMSSVYMENGDFDKTKAAIDHDSVLLWRHPPHRLEAEIIRDSLLAVSGTLDETMFGPGTLDLGHKRRSIYFFVKRSKLIPTMILFDAPDTLLGIEQRVSTTIAPQALLLINSVIVRGYAERFAEQISPTPETPLTDGVRSAYHRALGRLPSAEESADSLEFLKQQIDAYKAESKPDPRKLALTDFCQVLMGLNEFVYVD